LSCFGLGDPRCLAFGISSGSQTFVHLMYFGSLWHQYPFGFRRFGLLVGFGFDLFMAIKKDPFSWDPYKMLILLNIILAIFLL
jgi:hypothetical protein